MIYHWQTHKIAMRQTKKNIRWNQKKTLRDRKKGKNMKDLQGLMEVLGANQNKCSCNDKTKDRFFLF